MPSIVRHAATLAAAMLLGSSAAMADSGSQQLQPGGVVCAHLPRPTAWREQENWVWDMICSGAVANLGNFAGGGDDPRSSDGWPQKRELQAGFLRTILLDEPYRSAIPPAGVRISGAHFREPIDLAHAPLARELWLVKSRFDGEVSLQGVQSPGTVDLEQSMFAGKLDLSEIRIAGDLYLNDVVVPADLTLLGSWIGGEADLTGAKVTKMLDMYRIHVERDLTMNEVAGAGDVSLQSATVGGYLSMTGADISSDLVVEGAEINGALFAHNLHVSVTEVAGKASGGNADFHAVRVKGNVEFTYAHVERTLNVSASTVTRDLWLDGACQFGNLDLTGSAIGGDANLTGARIMRRLDMYGIHVARDLTMDGITAKEDVDMQSAATGGYVSMAGASISGILTAETIHDNGAFFSQKLRVGVADAGGKVSGGAVNLHAAQIMGNAEFTDAQLLDKLDMSNIAVGRDLLLDGEGKYAGIDLTGARIGSSVKFEQGEFGGSTDATDTNVGRDLLIRNAPHFLGRIDLTGLHTGGSLRLQSGTFEGPVLIDDAAMEQEFQIGEEAKRNGSGAAPGPSIAFHDSVQVKRARVTGDARIIDAAFKYLGNETATRLAAEQRDHAPMGRSMPMIIDMQAIQVGGELQLGQGTSFDGLVNLPFAHIVGNLDLTEGAFRGINLTGATIGSEIRLGSPQHPAPSWQPPEMLTLRNVSAGALQDLPGAASWPKILDLDGFTYSRLGGSQTASGEIGDRPEEDFTEWLEKQTKPSPQSYIELAQVLRAAGFPDKADSILYAGRMKEMDQAIGAHRFLLWLEYVVTGFGIYPLRALYSIAFLVALGSLAFRFDASAELRSFNWADRAIYSLDMLLPVVHLRKSNYEFEPRSWPRYYLYFHRLAGFVLASVIIASLTHGSVELHG